MSIITYYETKLFILVMKVIIILDFVFCILN